MAPRFIPVPSVPVYQPNESLGPKYTELGNRLMSGSGSVFESSPDSSSSIGLMEQFADYTEKKVDSLRERQKLFESQYALDQAFRDQEAKEADLILSDFLTDLSTYSGNQNWAGMWAKRRQIIDHPLYKNSSQVKTALSELDSRMENFGSDFTSDGKEVTFNDVVRMAGSGDVKEQKEAFRILALRSENGVGFLDSIPQEYFSSKDPTFRYQLRSFVKENPKIREDDVVRYQSLENEYVNSIKQQFANDPILVSRMLASDEVRDQLKDMRRSLFYGQRGSYANWLPSVSSSDLAINDDDLKDLTLDMKAKITQNRDNFMEEVGRSIGSLLSGKGGVTSVEEARERVATNPRLQAIVAQDMLPSDFSDAGVLAWAKNNPGTAIAGTVYTLMTVKKLSGIAALKKAAAETATTLKPPVPAAAGGGFGGFIRGGAWALAAGFSADYLLQNLYRDPRAIARANREVELAMGSLIHARSKLVSSLSAGTTDASRTFDQISRLMDSIDVFNRVSDKHNLKYQLDPTKLFGARQWQAIRSRAMALPNGMQIFGASGLMDRPGFSGPGYGAEGLTSQGNLGPGTPYGLSGPAQGSTLPNVNAMTGGVSPAPAAGGGNLFGNLSGVSPK